MLLTLSFPAYSNLNVATAAMLLTTAMLCLTIAVPGASGDGMIEVFRWSQMDFYNRGDSSTTIKNDNIVFPGPYQKQYSSQPAPDTTGSPNASYIAYNNVPMGVTQYNGRLFITMPRRRVGIPSTLNYIDLKKDEGSNPSPNLHAYPDFNTNYLSPAHEANPNRIISVYRTYVDECKRLWFIDTGMLEYPGNRIQVQPPSIWILDLETDTLVKRFEIPESVVSIGPGLASITVDVDANSCNQAFAYIPDLLHNALYAYSLETDRIWTFNHNYFHFDPIQGDFTIGGQSFSWDDGVFSVTMGPRQPDGFRTVFFHPMASTNEFSVSSRVLRNESNAERSYHGPDFQLLGSRGFQRQSTMHEYDPSTGIIFYDEIVRNGVGCWNTKKPFSEANHGTVVSDPQRMIYPSDLTIDNEGTIWVMTNSMPIFIYSTLDATAINFRVWKQSTRIAARNTVCA